MFNQNEAETQIFEPNAESGFERGEVRACSDGRRTFLKLIGAAAVAVLTADGARAFAGGNGEFFSLPAALQNGAVDLGGGDVGVMNYAFALEQTELAFLRRVIGNPYKGMTAAERQVFQDLHDHETVHNEFYKAMLGSRAIPALETDFSKVNFNDRESVLKTQITFADLATSAYNGAGKLLVDAVNLEIAGKIVSVEARHAAIARELYKPGDGFFAPDALDPAREPAEVLQIAKAFVKTPLDASRLPKGNEGKP